MNFLEFYEISWNFMKFHEISWNCWSFRKISVLRAPWGARLFNHCYFLGNIKVSLRVADGWKHKKSWFPLKWMKFPEFSWNLIIFMKFLQFHQVWATRRWHAETTVIPIVFQWLQRAHSSPGTPKSYFHENIGFELKFWGFSWNLVKFSSRMEF